MERELPAIFVIIILFSLGFAFFFMVVSPYGDVTEKTMEEGDVKEEKSGYGAPLDYGDYYIASFVTGFIGFAVMLIVMILLLKFMRKKNETQEHLTKIYKPVINFSS